MDVPARRHKPRRPLRPVGGRRADGRCHIRLVFQNKPLIITFLGWDVKAWDALAIFAHDLA